MRKLRSTWTARTARMAVSTLRTVSPCQNYDGRTGDRRIFLGAISPAARAIYDILLSEEGQRAIVAGDMYAALPELPPPSGARSLSEIAVRTWAPGFLDRVRDERPAIKRRYEAIVAGSQ